MKKLLILLFLATAAMANAQSMKMVVDSKGRVVGRYISTKGNKYEISIQDDELIPVAGHRVVTFSAAKGQGIIYRNQSRTGNINIRKGPGTNFPVVAKLPEDEGIPATYPCLGKENGWYKIRVNGRIGYIRQDMAEWDGMDSF